jgi:ELWxxDGT repeat protein
VVFFTAVADGAGARLWRSDGSAAGTMPIAAIAPALAVDPFTDAVIVGRMLYFTADDAQSGSELWALPLTGLAPECRHDCDQDFTVDVSDLVRGVRIALGAARLDTCALMDANGDGAVAIDELIAAVGEAPAGC